MSYVDPDFHTKKEFKDAVRSGQQLTTYNPSGMFPTRENGVDTIEGPHFPKPHRWYCRVQVVDHCVVNAEGAKPPKEARTTDVV
jgi:hypothetical protein